MNELRAPSMRHKITKWKPLPQRRPCLEELQPSSDLMMLLLSCDEMKELREALKT